MSHQGNIENMKWFKNLAIDKKYNVIVMMFLLVALTIASVIILSSTNRTFNTVVANNSKEINKQIILNYESYFDNIRETGNYIELNSRNLDLSNGSELEDFYINISSSNQDTITISLLAMDGSVLVTSKPNSTPYNRLNERNWFTKAVANEEVFFFSTPHRQDVFLQSNQTVISVSKVIEYNQGGELTSGVLIIELSMEEINTLARQTNLGEGGHLIITSETGDLIYSSTEECLSSTCTSNEIVQRIIIGGDFVEIDDLDMYVNINTIQGTRWRIATFVNTEIIFNSRTTIILTLFTVLGVTIVASTIAISLITKQITKPLNELKEHMMGLQHSDHLYQEVHVSGQKEVVILAEAYNDMIREIRVLLDRLVNEQTAKRKTELKALQTQINPHFLYNTLDSIVWLSEQKENDSVIKMVVALSRFFRISISRGKDIIPIDDEIQHAKYYLKIQKIRYLNQFEYVFEIDEEVRAYSVVKLVLQPLIENAIHHGIVEDEPGKITIRGYLKEETIYFEVINSGYGLNQEQIDEIYRKMLDDNYDSVGLKNVFQRLKLYYGDKSGITIASTMDESTTITIYFPVKVGT